VTTQPVDNDTSEDVLPPAYVAAHKAQAAALKEEAAEQGLRFQAYFVPRVAEWVLGEIERGCFLDPSEAVFVAMQTFMELVEHPDLQQELFRREIQKSLADPRPGMSGEEVLAKLEAKMKEAAGREPPAWNKIPHLTDTVCQE
jgi:antitoxin ParD1/3/4